ncbi:MAG TPA: thiamine pyrophosphate-binding protein, partial [Blastocatellia bacterium]
MANRRDFLKGAAVVGAATLSPSLDADSLLASPSQRPDAAPVMSALGEGAAPQELPALTTEHSGSDFMVDVIKSLGFEFICANPGSSFRGLHESVVNYGSNNNPELITCCHEESAVAMAHGYAKIEGKPIGVFVHSMVGLQHASMAIYNAYCDRAPVFVFVGNTLDATQRRPGAEWSHSVQDAAAMVRDCVKWDDMPVSLGHFAESAVRAYKIAMTPPMSPVLLVADSELQERPITEPEKPHIPKLTLATPPQGEENAVAEVARLLVTAENPVLVADRLARTEVGMKRLVELAETLQAAVIDQAGRMNFPSRHPLNQSSRSRATVAAADVIVGLELIDFWGTVNALRDQLYKASRPATKAGVKTISIGVGDLYIKSNFQNFQRFLEVDVASAADGEATLPSLIEAVKRLITDDRKRAFEARGAKLATASRAALEKARGDAAYAWDASPISTA